ncbi:unnamed protein product [Lepeophtheirus salmonis]|uniref:(salmon louse) hypothetical protein n=1 Tax=Lepeophtheirus salmonis TaxID=72036 RepID=A0A7R8CJB5_LEPSM|nr:unnamed protein product [Lepeophtheirus salmonis]CAF2840719.1 unnamed protein product [Lepeophtheirus salmonis]
MSQFFTKMYFETGAEKISVYETYEAMTLMVCAMICHGALQCWAFEYKMNECRLITSYSINENGQDRIYIKEPCIFRNYDTTSNNVQLGEGKTLDNCILECKKDPNCHHIVYNTYNLNCYLKDEFNSIYHIDSAIVAMQCLKTLNRVTNVIKLA